MTTDEGNAFEVAAHANVCSECKADVPASDLFCENCGHRLSPPPPPSPGCACGAPPEDVDDEGFCQCCGRRVRRPASDHLEEAFSPDFAAISDRGLQHQANEDRFALLSEVGWQAAVVCDGVSSTQNPALASEVVTRTVTEQLREAFRREASADASEMLLAAMRESSHALADECRLIPKDVASSTTVVAALLQGSRLTVAWAGDSRAYWIDQAGHVQALTRDHSWLQNALDSGELTAAEASASPQAHAILRWIGPDIDPTDPATAPEFAQRILTAPGTLLLCTDGLWNYAPDETSMAALLTDALSAEPNSDAQNVVRRLIDFAIGQGGRDNITAVLLRWSPPVIHAAEVEPAEHLVRTEAGKD